MNFTLVYLILSDKNTNYFHNEIAYSKNDGIDLAAHVWLVALESLL